MKGKVHIPTKTPTRLWPGRATYGKILFKKKL